MRSLISIFVLCFSLMNFVSGCDKTHSSEVDKPSFSQELSYSVSKNNEKLDSNASSLNSYGSPIGQLFYSEETVGVPKYTIPYIYPPVEKDLTNEFQGKHTDNASTKAESSSAKTRGQLFTNESFPVIILDVPNRDEAFKQAKKWGITHVHRYAMGISIEKDQSFFDRTADHELKVMSNLRLKRWIDRDGGIDSMRAYIQHFKDHSALGFWYLSDEPDNKGFSPPEVVPFYKMVKKQTPGIAVAVAHARSKNWYRYGEVQDVFMYDNYPIEGESFPGNRLNGWTDFTKKAIKRGRKEENVVVPILQMFNWKAMAQEGQKKIRGFDVEKLRYPNKQELRYMSFSSIALGAKGLTFYSYYRSRMVDRDWAGRVLSPVIHEAKAFRKQVANAQKQIILQGENKDFFLTLWTGKEDTFMILVNASPKSLQVQQSLKGALEEGRLEPWGDTRKAKAILEDGSISVGQIRPWEVLIWRII